MFQNPANMVQQLVVRNKLHDLRKKLRKLDKSLLLKMEVNKAAMRSLERTAQANGLTLEEDQFKGALAEEKESGLMELQTAFETAFKDIVAPSKEKDILKPEPSVELVKRLRTEYLSLPPEILQDIYHGMIQDKVKRFATLQDQQQTFIDRFTREKEQYTESQKTSDLSKDNDQHILIIETAEKVLLDHESAVTACERNEDQLTGIEQTIKEYETKAKYEYIKEPFAIPPCLSILGNIVFGLVAAFAASLALGALSLRIIEGVVGVEGVLTVLQEFSEMLQVLGAHLAEILIPTATVSAVIGVGIACGFFSHSKSEKVIKKFINHSKSEKIEESGLSDSA